MWLVVVTGVGLALRITYVVVQKHSVLGVDAAYFFDQARLAWNGTGWFIDPFAFIYKHHAVLQSATHPPLWTLVLVLADAVGLRTYESHLVVASLVGSGAVFVTGCAARDLAGPRAGLIAAGIAAVYPNYWINDGTGVAESLLLLLVATAVLVGYRFWRRPSLRLAVALGGVCGLAALTRAEQLLLVVAVLIPVALVIRGRSLRRRLALAGAGVLTAVVVIAPWVGFNMARFSRPVLMSDDVGSTLVFSNCRTAYSGPLLGYGDFLCLDAVSPGPGDESVQDDHYRRVALHYIRGHLGRVPLVMAARLGRELGFFKPFDQLRTEDYWNSRPLVPARIGLVMYYGMLVGAVGGALVLRRRGITLVPLVGLLLEVAATAMVSIGATRYRVPLEVGLVVSSAVALDALVTRIGARRSASGTGALL